VSPCLLLRGEYHGRVREGHDAHPAKEGCYGARGEASQDGTAGGGGSGGVFILYALVVDTALTERLADVERMSCNSREGAKSVGRRGVAGNICHARLGETLARV
jgi:hypothetical protein